MANIIETNLVETDEKEINQGMFEELSRIFRARKATNAGGHPLLNGTEGGKEWDRQQLPSNVASIDGECMAGRRQNIRVFPSKRTVEYRVFVRRCADSRHRR